LFKVDSEGSVSSLGAAVSQNQEIPVARKRPFSKSAIYFYNKINDQQYRSDNRPAINDAIGEFRVKTSIDRRINFT